MSMGMSPWYYIYVLTQWQLLFPNLIHHISLSVNNTQEAILTMTGVWSGTKTRQTMNLSSQSVYLLFVCQDEANAPTLDELGISEVLGEGEGDTPSLPTAPPKGTPGLVQTLSKTIQWL